MADHLGKNNPFASETVSPFAVGARVRRNGMLGHPTAVGTVIGHFRRHGHWMLTVRFASADETFAAETYHSID